LALRAGRCQPGLRRRSRARRFRRHPHREARPCVKQRQAAAVFAKRALPSQYSWRFYL